MFIDSYFTKRTPYFLCFARDLCEEITNRDVFLENYHFSVKSKRKVPVRLRICAVQVETLLFADSIWTLTNFSLATHKRDISEQCRLKSDATELDV